MVRGIVDPYKEQLEAWLNADLRRPKRERRTAKVLFNQIRALGYSGSCNRVAVFVKR